MVVWPKPCKSRSSLSIFLANALAEMSGRFAVCVLRGIHPEIRSARRWTYRGAARQRYEHYADSTNDQAENERLRLCSRHPADVSPALTKVRLMPPRLVRVPASPDVAQSIVEPRQVVRRWRMDDGIHRSSESPASSLSPNCGCPGLPGMQQRLRPPSLIAVVEGAPSSAMEPSGHVECHRDMQERG